MTAKKRAMPISEARELLDLLASYGVPIAECAIDIGPNGVKVSPPANSNPAGDSLGKYINRAPPGAKAPEKR